MEETVVMLKDYSIKAVHDKIGMER